MFVLLSKLPYSFELELSICLWDLAVIETSFFILRLTLL